MGWPGLVDVFQGGGAVDVGVAEELGVMWRR